MQKQAAFSQAVFEIRDIIDKLELVAAEREASAGKPGSQGDR